RPRSPSPSRCRAPRWTGAARPTPTWRRRWRRSAPIRTVGPPCTEPASRSPACCPARTCLSDTWPPSPGRGCEMAFDLRRFAESSEPVKYEDLDFDTLLSQPLDEQTLRSLRYMSDVEYHTSSFLPDLLVTPSPPNHR